MNSRFAQHERGIAPVVGIALLIAMTIVLTGVVAVSFTDQPEPEPAEHAVFKPTVDVGDDAIRLRHLSGDGLFADRIRLVWTIKDQRYTSDPTTSHTELSPGEAVTFYFDGTTQSTGTWTSYPSPGSTNIQPNDSIELAVYDTDRSQPVVEKSFTASDLSGDLSTAAGELLWLHDQTAGKSGVRVELAFTIQSGSSTIGNSLNSIEIVMDDSTLSLFSGTTQSSVVKVGVDTDGDGTVDTDIQGDMDAWTVQDGGSHLKIGFGGSAYTNPEAGHTIILVVDDITNPSTGVYDAQVQTSGDGNWQHGNIETT